MNKERILSLAATIETQPHKSCRADDGFNMGAWVHSCRTPSCIAGFAIAQRDQTGIIPCNFDFDYTKEAGDFLGLSYDLADKLFLPYVFAGLIESITPAQAAWTLRNLAETGEVVWQL